MSSSIVDAMSLSSDSDDDPIPTADTPLKDDRTEAEKNHERGQHSLKILAVMSIGLTKENGSKCIDPDSLPWSSLKKREFKPSRKNLVDEIIRRAEASIGRVRPANWSAPKCEEWLVDHPIEQADDVQYIKSAVERFEAIHNKKLEEVAASPSLRLKSSTPITNPNEAPPPVAVINLKRSRASPASTIGEAYVSGLERMTDKLVRTIHDGQKAINDGQNAITTIHANRVIQKEKRVDHLEDIRRELRMKAFIGEQQKDQETYNFYMGEVKHIEQEIGDLKQDIELLLQKLYS